MPVPAIIVVLLVMLALAREQWLFHQRPKESDEARARGDRARARTILEDILSKPALFGARSRSSVHARLAWSYLEDGRPHDAAEQARRSLDSRLHPAIESLHRLRLADCLEACGETAEADRERARAAQLAANGPENAARLLAQGKTLRKAGRHADAIPVYERAIALTDQSLPSVRAHLMVTLALSCWEAGRINQALRWAEQALALGPDLIHRTSAYSVSALALGSLGRLDEAEERWQLAYDVAEQAGNTIAAARYLASLAEVQRRRGRLLEAFQSCDRAAGMSLESRRAAKFAAFECYLTWGRLADAREMLEQGARAQGFAIPASEIRIQALTTMNRGLLAAEEGRFEEALSRIEESRPVLETDEKLGMTWHVMRAWIEAERGNRADSEASAQAATTLSIRMPDDRAAMLRYHTYLGRAALAAGEVESALHHFESAMKLRPDPVEVPRAHYFLGECRRALGDVDGALTEWQAAVDSGLDTRYVSLAKARLAKSAD